MNPTITVFNHNGTYCYRVNGGTINYYHRFPMDWALNHISSMPGCEIGPELCGNCRVHGSIGDVFIGYCCNCALYITNRGIGLLNNCAECTFDDVGHLTKFQTKEDFESHSIYKSYMKGVEIDILKARHQSKEVHNGIMTNLKSQETFHHIKNM